MIYGKNITGRLKRLQTYNSTQLPDDLKAFARSITSKSLFYAPTLAPAENFI
jgi:hypothetical protein